MADFTIIDVHNLAPAMGVVSTDLLAVGQSDTNLHKLSLGELSNYLGTSGGLLEFNDLDGFLYDVQYNSTNHRLTFYQQNEPNIVIDLPIEQLIKGVQLVGNDLIFTFEDGSTVTVPLNTLLVGVVKSVNGLTPNSQGEIILNVTDIPNLSNELANKLDVRMAGLVNNLTQPEKDAILTKLGVVNNIVQVLGLSGNTITLSNGGGSISLNIANIGGLQTALDLKANTSGSNLTNIPNWQSVLGINTSWNLQQVTANGNTTPHGIITNNGFYIDRTGFNSDAATEGKTNLGHWKWGVSVGANADKFNIYDLSKGYSRLDILPNGYVGISEINPQAMLHVNGNAIVDDATALNHAVALGQLANYALLSQVYTQAQSLALFVGLNGVQTIADTKTFSSSPIVPNATLNGHAVNLGQLNTKANIDGSNISPTTWSNLTSGNSEKWNNQSYNGNVNNNINFIMSLDLASGVWRPSDDVGLKAFLGISNLNTSPSLQYVMSNGNSSTLPLDLMGLYLTGNTFFHDSVFAFRERTSGGLQNVEVKSAVTNNHAVNLGQLNNAISSLPTPIIYTGSNGVILVGNDFQLNASTLNSLSLANSALQAETDPIFTASVAYGITSGNITSWNAKQNQLTNGLHTTLSSNQINVAFDVNTYVKDKSNNDRLLFGNTSSTDIVIHGAVANGDFKVKDSTGADMFRMNGSNKVPYFPQLPAPQTGASNNLAIFDSGNGLWKSNLNIGDLATTTTLGNYYTKTETNDLLDDKANVNGNNLTNIPNWQSVLGINTSWDLQQVMANGNVSNIALDLLGLYLTGNVFYHNSIFEFRDRTNGELQNIIIADATASNHAVNLGQLLAYNYTTLPLVQSWVGTQNFSTQTLANSTSNLIVSNTVQRAALTGDVTAAQNSNATTIATSAVTFPKIQNITTQTLLGRATAGTGNVEELTANDVKTILGLPDFIGNGSFTVQGTGALTGTGSTSANATANTTADLDLTAQTKSDIALGVRAKGKLDDLYGNLDSMFQFYDISSGGTIDAELAFTTLLNAVSSSAGITVKDHVVNGAVVEVQGCLLGGLSTININHIDRSGTPRGSLDIEQEVVKFYWDSGANAYRLVNIIN